MLTVAAVQFKTTHKYTNAPTRDTYSMLLPETTCNRAKLKLTSEDSGVIALQYLIYLNLTFN